MAQQQQGGQGQESAVAHVVQWVFTTLTSSINVLGLIYM